MTADCDSACPYYDYDPSIAGNAILLAAYSILIPAVFYPGLRISTLAFSIILVAGLALDVIGFVGRLLLSRSPDGQDYFTISLIGTILGPTLITCAVILTFPCTLSLCDLYVSHLRRGFAVLLLLVSTLGAAVLEVIGIVSVAYRLGDISRARGAELIAGGLGIQATALLGFVGLQIWVLVRMMMNRHSILNTRHAAVCRTSRFKRFVFRTAAASVLLLAYSIYRIIETIEGIQGRLFQNQIIFIIINGVLPLLAAALVIVFQPSAVFDDARNTTSPLSLHQIGTVPPPSLKSTRQQMQEKTHHRYDPDIRKQLSPSPQRPLRHSNPPQGSPSLPPNPRPVRKAGLTSPMPSPTATTDRGPSRLSERSHTREPRTLVDRDALW